MFAFGLFGFAGGITNWLAVKMLFDEVPGLIGSGVIPKRFEEIRRAVKKTIMKTFFDKKFIEKCVASVTLTSTLTLTATSPPVTCHPTSDM